MISEKMAKALAKTNATQKRQQERRKKKFLKALEEGSGIQAYALQACHLSRTTVNKWKHSDEEFAQQCQDIEDNCIDRVEAKLLEQINDGNITAIIFYLKTKGKKHGYVETIENNITASPFLKLMKELPDDPDEDKQ